jgi:hypothetical protein
MKIEVTITEQDIARGERHCGTECPAVYALRRVFGPDVIDRVTRAYIVFRDGKRKRSPKCLAGFCRDFDNGGTRSVKPLTFTVSI